ncbi:MAG TPA: hypothetical protein VFU15_05410 [Bacteroidia bacterium]|nr:hypothetical protein [Bacteroidia bacterium]
MTDLDFPGARWTGLCVLLICALSATGITGLILSLIQKKGLEGNAGAVMKASVISCALPVSGALLSFMTKRLLHVLDLCALPLVFAVILCFSIFYARFSPGDMNK